jgi:DNA-binding MarR family transcriptional regulator
MSTKSELQFPASLSAPHGGPRDPVDIRDVFSYRIALLARINDRDAQNQLMTRYGITLGEWRTLAVIRYQGSCTLGQLAGEGFLDIGQVSRSVTTLVDRGWVMRRADDKDRRALALSLTDAGEALYQQVMVYVRTANAAMLGALTPGEQDRLYELLDRVMDSLRDELAR